MELANLGIGFSFLAGLASFLSPCVFSLIPAYIGYLSGRSVSLAGKEKSRYWITLSHGFAFVLGFSMVFISLGLGTSALGSLLFNIRPWLTKIGGIVVILFGLQMVGILRLPFLLYDTRRQFTPNPRLGYLSSVFMGIFFSAGWSPCVGPVLGTILTLSLSEGSIRHGLALLAAYSMGLAIPFLITATQIGLVTNMIRRYGKVMHYIEVTMGVVLIGVGILLFLGKYQQFANFGSFFSIIDEIYVGQLILIGIIAAMSLGLIPAMIAKRKGRRFIDWWIFGSVLFVIALPLALTVKNEGSMRDTSE
jgi:cytochrome c-type biogenesis protein